VVRRFGKINLIQVREKWVVGEKVWFVSANFATLVHLNQLEYMHPYVQRGIFP
jgi:hypothetical protein